MDDANRSRPGRERTDADAVERRGEWRVPRTPAKEHRRMLRRGDPGEGVKQRALGDDDVPQHDPPRRGAPAFYGRNEQRGDDHRREDVPVPTFLAADWNVVAAMPREHARDDVVRLRESERGERSERELHRLFRTASDDDRDENRPEVKDD